MAAANSFGVRAGFPDVCLTPTPVGPVPLPYPNFSMEATDVPIAVRINVDGGTIGTLADMGTISMGDQAGLGGGVASGTDMLGAHGIVANPKVLSECMPTRTWLSLHLSNQTNCPAVYAYPGQVKLEMP